MKQCAEDQAVRVLSGGVADFPVTKRDNRSKRDFSQVVPHALGYPADCLTAAPVKKGSGGLMAVLNDLKVLFQPKQFCDSCRHNAG